MCLDPKNTSYGSHDGLCVNDYIALQIVGNLRDQNQVRVVFFINNKHCVVYCNECICSALCYDLRAVIYTICE